MANQQVMTLLDEMKRDKNIVDQVIEKLPPKVKKGLRSKTFRKRCEQQFASLDVDGSGVLEPEELFPLLGEMSRGRPWHNAITVEHCIDFANLFDADCNGVISLAEFGLFCKFAFVMSYLNSLKAKAASDPDADAALTASSL